MIEASINGVLALCIDIEAGDEIRILDLCPFLIDKALVELMLLLQHPQILLIGGLDDLLQVLFLLLEFQLENFLLSLIVLFEVVNWLLALGSEVHCNFFVEVRRCHGLELVLQSIHNLTHAHILELEALVLSLDLYFLQLLLRIEIIKYLQLHR